MSTKLDLSTKKKLKSIKIINIMKKEDIEDTV